MKRLLLLGVFAVHAGTAQAGVWVPSPPQISGWQELYRSLESFFLVG